MSLRGRGVFDYIVKDPGTVAQISKVIMSSFLLGVLTILTLAATFFSMRRGLLRRSICIQLFSVAILYVSTCIYFAISAVYFTNVYSSDTVSLYSPVNPFSASGWDEDAQKAQSWIFTVTLTINALVTDAIVWWRACAVWQNNRYVLVGCTSVLVIAFVLGSISSCETNGFFLNQGGHKDGLDIYGIACFFLLLISNIASTSLIGYKAWEHRHVLRESLHNRTRTSRAMTLMSLLIESGTGYSLLWLAFAVCNVYLFALGGANSGPLSFLRVYDVVSAGGVVYLVAAYPMLVIVLVNINQSQLDTWRAGGTAGSSSVRFADVENNGQRSTITQLTTYFGATGAGTS